MKGKKKTNWKSLFELFPEIVLNMYHQNAKKKLIYFARERKEAEWIYKKNYGELWKIKKKTEMKRWDAN